MDDLSSGFSDFSPLPDRIFPLIHMRTAEARCRSGYHGENPTMMNTITKIDPATATPVGAHKVDTSRGSSNMIASRQWISRPADQKFLSLSALLGSVKARRDASAELRIDNKGIEFFSNPEPKTMADTHDMWIGLKGGIEIAPTHWSFGQVCSLAKAPASYLRTIPAQIASDALTYGLRHAREVEQVKLYHTNEELLAATGPDYGRIFDAEVVEAVMQIAGDGTGDTRWKVPGRLDWRTMMYDPEHPISIDTTTLYASDRDVWIMLVDDRNPIEIGKLKDGSPDYLMRGFIITNSEVGKSALKIFAFYFRAICCNHILWGVENFQEITLRHSRLAPSRFIEEARPALASFAEGATAKLLDAIDQAKSIRLASDQDEALEFLTARKISRTRALSILERGENEEGEPPRTAWQMVQAITADARDIRHMDERIEQEQIAKAILDKVV
jgi:Domain of unknown function (DUF932)